MVRCAIVCMMGLLGTQSAFSADLIVNPSFEELDPETGFPTGWEATYWSNPKGTIEAADIAHTGARSLMLRGLPREQITDAGRANNHLALQQIALLGQRRLTVTVFVRTEGTGSAYLSVMTQDADGERLQYASSGRQEQVGDWQEVVWSFTTSPETRTLQLYLRNGGEGAVYFDDVSLSSAEDVLDSGPVTAIVEPLVGGRVSSLLVPSTGRALTPWRGVYPGGLAGIIVPGDGYPGLLRDVPWQMEVT